MHDKLNAADTLLQFLQTVNDALESSRHYLHVVRLHRVSASACVQQGGDSPYLDCALLDQVVQLRVKTLGETLVLGFEGIGVHEVHPLPLLWHFLLVADRHRPHHGERAAGRKDAVCQVLRLGACHGIVDGGERLQYNLPQLARQCVRGEAPVEDVRGAELSKPVGVVGGRRRDDGTKP